MEDSGSKVKLKTWAQRKGRSLGYEAPGGKPVPLIDRVHRLMHLWKGGDVHKVDEYLDEQRLCGGRNFSSGCCSRSSNCPPLEARNGHCSNPSATTSRLGAQRKKKMRNCSPFNPRRSEMIRLVETLNFRCLRYIRQPLENFHVLVGPNASGKTTFLDVISFLGQVVSDGWKRLLVNAPKISQTFFGPARAIILSWQWKPQSQREK